MSVFTFLWFCRYCSQLGHCQSSHAISVLKTLTLHCLHFFILELCHSLQLLFFFCIFVTNSGTPIFWQNRKVIFSIARCFIYISEFHYFSLNMSLLDLFMPLLPPGLFIQKACYAYGFGKLPCFHHPGNSFSPLFYVGSSLPHVFFS